MKVKENNSVRIDKWLWAVRLFKTRSQATEACKKNKVLVDDEPVKPSYGIKPGQTVVLKNSPYITRTFQVKGLIEKRVGAKIAVQHVEETTPQEEFDRMALIKNNPFAVRDRGMGRPTKRDRREIQRLVPENDEEQDDFYIS